MCDVQNNGKIQREFETRSTDDQPTIQWLPVVGSWTFLGVNMHFNEKLFMCDSCNFLVRAYQTSDNRTRDRKQDALLENIVLRGGTDRSHHHDCVTSGQYVLFQHSNILTLHYNRPI